jgi:hypothetical protein
MERAGLHPHDEAESHAVPGRLASHPFDPEEHGQMHRPALTPLVLAATLLASAATAADSPSSTPPAAAHVPNTTLAFDIPKLQAAIRVDGRLDDPAWRNAARLTNFVEIDPGDNTPPAVNTVAMIAYDADHLYIGFECHDSAPDAIRATITDRDRMFADDWVGVFIDTFRDQQNGYEFVVNPRGIQGDLRRARNNEDSSFDAVWYSGGQITSDGWTAEIALPFRSLRFPNAEVQSWGIHLFRTRPRESRVQMSWAPISRDESCFFCQAGVMGGIEGVNQGRNFEILPYALASQAGTLSGENDASFDWNNDDAAGEAGVGLKYGITPNHTLDLTYNPDFSQIESDATQIDANRTFALFYPEKRPFFQEGADMFATDMDVVYTRSINDPLTAGKFTGKSGKNTVAVMAAHDENSPYIVPLEEQSEGTNGGNTVSGILRYKRDVLTESFIGLLATDRHALDNDGFNTTAGVDTRLRFSENFAFSVQAMASYTREPDDTTLSAHFSDERFGDGDQYDSQFNGEEFGGHAVEAEFVRSGRHYNANLVYDGYSPTFRADNGFVTANNYHLVNFWNGYQFQLDNHPVFERIEPQLQAGRKYNFQGEFKDTWLEPSIWLRFKKQTRFWTGILWSEEVFAGTRVDGIRRWMWDLDSEFSKLLQGGGYMRIGHSVVRDRDNPRLGDEFSWGASLTLKPTSQVRVDLTHDAFNLDELDGGAEIYNTFVSRAKLTYQFTGSLFLRAVGEYVDSNRSFALDPLLSYKINPFTVFFAGSSHSFNEFEDDPATPGREVADEGFRQTERLFFVKLQYLIRA